MKILIDLIANPQEKHGVNIDHRFSIWKTIASDLIKRGHDVWCNKLTKSARKNKSFPSMPRRTSFKNEGEVIWI